MKPMELQADSERPWWLACPWTLGVCVVLMVANLGLFLGAGSGFDRLVELLQFDRGAIRDGQFWRLLTGNLVHWSREHFWLDVGAFALVGLLYEKAIGRRYPWVLLLGGLAVGGGVLLFVPEMATYRGLSGVDSGQFAAAVAAEFALARRDRRRWLWALPAGGVFAVKIASECATGGMFFGTESLGDIGEPVALAHAAGVAAAAAILLADGLRSALESDGVDAGRTEAGAEAAR